MLNLGQVALVEQDNCNCPPKYSRSEPQSRRPRRSSRYPNPPPTPASVRVPLLLSGENRLLLGGTEMPGVELPPSKNRFRPLKLMLRSGAPKM